jgi:hypothetical protein
MNPGVPQVMFGLFLIVAGILVIKALGNDLGWIVFTAGVVAASAGGIRLAQSGAKEVGN